MKKSPRQKNTSERQSGKKDEFPEREPTGSPSENCRCKEVAKKTPSEMLGLMISDLTFWKKAKGKK